MSGRRAPSRALAAAALLAALALPAAAHNLAPAYLELRELAGGAVAVRWKQSALVPRGARLTPRLPCAAASEPAAREEGDALVLEWRLACGASLVGARVAVGGLAGSGTDALLRVALADGREVRAILTASAPELEIPARERAGAVLRGYGLLGAKHLWTGADHLLFVAGLALAFGATRRLVIAISAFTAGHSVTLAAAALGVVRVPQAPVEVAIAATIVALALGLARAGDFRAPAGSAAARPRGISRRPALLPLAFGLLHGLGFAGALAELGLPQHAIPLALFAFNAGIELAQLALVGLLLAAALVAARAGARLARSPAHAARARGAAVHALGGLGVFWCLDRAAGLLFP